MRGAMSNDSVRRRFWARARGCAVLGLLVGFSACGLEKVTIPPLGGPSELGISVKLTASPDVLTADGISTARIQAEVRGPNGQPVGGKDIFFAIASETGLFADIGSLSHNRALTDGAGIAQVIYRVPPRTDATAHQFVLVDARPVGDDARAAVYRSVAIELRSAEPFLFPSNPVNGRPVAQITVEPPTGSFVGDQILFQGSGSYDTEDGNGRVGHVVRYHWDFGDGTRDDKPDVNHAYGFASTFKVSLVVTDDEGAQSAPATVSVTIK